MGVLSTSNHLLLFTLNSSQLKKKLFPAASCFFVVVFPKCWVLRTQKIDNSRLTLSVGKYGEHCTQKFHGECHQQLFPFVGFFFLSCSAVATLPGFSTAPSSQFCSWRIVFWLATHKNRPPSPSKNKMTALTHRLPPPRPSEFDSAPFQLVAFFYFYFSKFYS